MKNLKVPGTGRLYGTERQCGAGRQHITVSNRNFHSRIMEKHSPVKSLKKKSFLSFPFLFFREDTGGSSIWNNQFIFPVRFQFLKQIFSGAPRKNKKRAENRVLQSFREGKHSVHQGMPDLRGIIPRNSSIALELIPGLQKGAHFRHLSRNDGFYPVLGSRAVINLLHGEIPGRNHLYDSITAQETEIFTLFPEEENRITIIKKAHNRRRSYEKPFKMPDAAKKGRQSLDQFILKDLVTGNTLSDLNTVSVETFPVRKAVFEKDFPVRSPVSRKVSFGKNAIYKDSAPLSPKYFPEAASNLNSRLIVPSASVFESELTIDRFPAKKAYSQVSGKKLVFNTGTGINQELERKVAAIKEELVQAEKVSQANYSSMYSKLEKELKQKLEINRLSEQVIQQIVWRLKIEKERRGLL